MRSDRLVRLTPESHILANLILIWLLSASSLDFAGTPASALLSLDA
ncbi:MAG: hypothetical protein GYB66_01060 [Chloroflexi bacterium]|nr:hypothetical protein [Chloroflexota bacterium]